MDFLHGHSLSEEIGESGIAKDRFFEIFEQVLSGVAAAHEAGIIHRDLTPSNIFIADSGPDAGTAKILDFGLAKFVTTEGESIASLTQTGTTLGTPAYMSPEHCMGRQTDARSDIYSLGCCMYEALSG
jgi:serine/threonine-protein kinase